MMSLTARLRAVALAATCALASTSTQRDCVSLARQTLRRPGSPRVVDFGWLAPTETMQHAPRKDVCEVAQRCCSGAEERSGSAASYMKQIRDLRKHRQWDQIVEVFETMQLQSVVPNLIIFNDVISACAKSKQPERAQQVFDAMLRQGVVPDVLTYNAMISACEKGKQRQLALKLFETMQGQRVMPNLITFKSLVNACETDAEPEIALELFEAMQERGVVLDVVSYNTLMSKRGGSAMADQALEATSSATSTHEPMIEITQDLTLEEEEEQAIMQAPLKWPDARLHEGHCTIQPNTLTHLDDKGSFVVYLPRAFKSLDGWSADDMFTELIKEVPWEQGETLFQGEWYPEPRLTSYYGDSGYWFAGKAIKPSKWNTAPSVLLLIKDAVENMLNLKFDGVLLNRYRDGSDSIGWHGDNDKVLGKNPQVASVTFAPDINPPRRFRLREYGKEQGSESCPEVSVPLGHGSLLWMGGSMQQHWQHSVPKQSHIRGERINLTFRRIVTKVPHEWIDGAKKWQMLS